MARLIGLISVAILLLAVSANADIALTASKCTVANGKTAGTDSMSFSGTFTGSLGDLNDVNAIEVSIVSSDAYEVYSETLSFDANDIKKNKYTYKHAKGAVTSLKLNIAKGTISLDAKNIDLYGLRCPFEVSIAFGASVLSGNVTETVANGSKPMPIKLLKGYDNALRVDKAKAKATSLTISGAIASGRGGGAGRGLPDKFDFSAGGTVAAWIKPSQTDDSWLYIFGPRDYGPRLFQMGTEIKFGTTVVPGQWGLSNITSSGAALEADTWYHIVGVYSYDSNDPNSSFMRLYVNGEELASIVDDPNCTNHAPKPVTCAFTIGNDINNDSTGFIGKIDDAVIYDYALTEAQVTALMNGTYTGATSHWDFEDGTDSTTADDSGLVQTGVLTADGKLLGTTSIVADDNDTRNLVLSCDGDPNNYVLCDVDGEDLLTNDVTITWDGQTFTLPASGTTLKKGKYTHSSPSTNDYPGIKKATFDFNNCTFTITIKNTPVTTTTGTVGCEIGFDQFDESVNVGL